MHTWQVNNVGMLGILFALAIGLGMASQCSNEDASNGEDGLANETMKVLLHFQPFTEPIATAVFIASDGEASSFDYAPARLTVLAIRQATIGAQRIPLLMSKADEPSFRRACDGHVYGAGGLARGDQFYLGVKAQGRTRNECSGFLPEAPEVVRTLVDEVLALGQQLNVGDLGDAYLRSAPIESDRLERLLEEENVRFLSFEQFSEGAEKIARDASTRPGEFFSLTQAQYDELLGLSSVGNEVFVLDIASGYQLTLFLKEENNED